MTDLTIGVTRLREYRVVLTTSFCLTPIKLLVRIRLT